MGIKTIDQFNFENKKALVRVDFNVPLNDHLEVTDDTRIQAAIPTIKKIIADNGSVILMSHLGRPKGGPEDKFSLKHIKSQLEKLLEKTVDFSNDCIGEEAQTKAKSLKPGDVLLLENLRFYSEETKGDKEFASKLAQLGDIYVNDAFGTAHRAHASTAVIAEFFKNSKCFGYLMTKEIKSIDKVLNKAQKPFVAIIGGAKVSSKISIIEELLAKVDHLIIGGGMAYTFIKAQGGKVGSSLVEKDYFSTALKIMESAKLAGVQIHLPVDSVNANGFSNDAQKSHSDIANIPEDEMGLDIGAKSITNFENVIINSKTILWNGPMGVFEFSNFQNGTKSIALAIAKATDKGAFSMIGGGDSVAAINQFELNDKVSYVSTGGGALLEYIEGKQLPGVVAILED